MTARPCHSTRILCHSLLGSFPSLTGFATDPLVSIADAFSMIRLRRSNATDFCGGLTDHFTVRTKHLDLARLLIYFKRDASRRWHFDRMRVTDKQGQILAAHFCAVTRSEE